MAIANPTTVTDGGGGGGVALDKLNVSGSDAFEEKWIGDYVTEYGGNWTTALDAGCASGCKPS